MLENENAKREKAKELEVCRRILKHKIFNFFSFVLENDKSIKKKK
jgi:hypothetical protein